MARFTKRLRGMRETWDSAFRLIPLQYRKLLRSATRSLRRRGWISFWMGSSSRTYVRSVHHPVLTTNIWAGSRILPGNTTKILCATSQSYQSSPDDIYCRSPSGKYTTTFSIYITTDNPPQAAHRRAVSTTPRTGNHNQGFRLHGDIPSIPNPFHPLPS